MALPSLMCTLSHHAWGASKGKWDTPAPGPPRRSLCPSPAASPHPSHFLPKASSPAGSVPAPPAMVEDNSTLCALMAEPCQMAADGVFPWGPTLASCKDQPSLGARLLPPPRCHIFRHGPWKEPFAEQIPPPPQLPWGPRLHSTPGTSSAGYSLLLPSSPPTARRPAWSAQCHPVLPLDIISSWIIM